MATDEKKYLGKTGTERLIQNVIAITNSLQDDVDGIAKVIVVANEPVAAATHTKITYDAKGLVAGGEDLSPSDIPVIGSEKISDLQDKIDASVQEHNVNEEAHGDIRGLVSGLTTRLNALANSTEEDLDQMAEVVAYIKSNKDLIDAITTSKVSVADIVDNLTTSDSKKPLSAAQGVIVKAMIDGLQVDVDERAMASDLTSHTGNTDIHIIAEERSSWNDANSKKHTHGNKSIIDDISESTISELNTAFEHTSDSARHITDMERTNWNAAKAHADSDHAPVEAEPNQNAFSSISVDDTAVSANSTTDTVAFIGDKVSISADSANGVITFSIENEGVVAALGYDPPSVAEVSNLYVWKKYNSEKTIVETAYSSIILSHKNSVSTNYADLSWDTVEYADSIEVSNNTIKLVDPTSFTCDSIHSAEIVLGKYIESGHKSTLGQIYKIPADATLTSGSLTVGEGGYVYVSPAIKQSYESIPTNFIEFVTSRSSNQHPENGVHSDGYWYELIGQIGDAFSSCNRPLPEVTTANEGAFLQVVNGAWAVSTIPYAEEGNY